MQLHGKPKIPLFRAGFVVCALLLGYLLFNEHFTVASRSKVAAKKSRVQVLVNDLREQVSRHEKRIRQEQQTNGAQDRKLKEQDAYIRQVTKQRDRNHKVIGEYDTTSRTLLKALIKKDFPTIDAPEVDDWTKVNWLREWSYRNTDWGANSTLVNVEPGVNYYEKPATTLFSYFLRDRGGVYCGGTAFVRMKLYRIFGLSSYTYGMGAPGEFTHTVTLVRIRHSGRDVLVIQDPAFNLTYVDAKQEPLDFFQVITLLKNREIHRLKTLSGRQSTREIVVTTRQELDAYRKNIVPADSRGERLPDGKLKCRVRLTQDLVLGIYGEKKIRGELKKSGLPPQIEYLFLRPIAFNGGSELSILAQSRKLLDQTNAILKPVETSHIREASFPKSRLPSLETDGPSR